MAARKTGSKKAVTKKISRKKTVPARLSSDEKLRMLKAGDDVDDLVHEFTTAWAGVSRKVKVPGASPAGLAALGRKVVRARQKEIALEAKLRAQLAPRSDARMRAGDEALRMLYKARKIARAVADGDPEVAEAFARFDAMMSERAATEPKRDPSPA